MRAHLLVLAVAVAACGDDTAKNPDLSSGRDLSVAVDFSTDQPSDLSAPSPDLTVVPSTPSGMIQAVRGAADIFGQPDGGTLTMNLPVAGVYVTYIRPDIAGENGDAPGFFVQAEQTGPALFVLGSPSALSPAPQVGDLVQFTVTDAGLDAGGAREATAITDWMVTSHGNPLTSLVQDLSAATDLSTKVSNYESELSTITGTVSSAFTSSGMAYVQATFLTAGLPMTMGAPKLRIPLALRDSLDITNGCVVVVGPTPLWRFSTTAQPSAWVNSDLSITSCPAPRIVSAVATSATQVVVTFDRFLKAASLVADGSQFTFNGLTASAATLTAPNQVTLTTTAQTATTLYTVIGGGTLLDTRSLALDVAHNSAGFTGFTAPAKLIISEFNANISSGGSDQVELKALTAGSVGGFTLYEDYLSTNRTTLAVLPQTLVVDAGDYIVVHLGNIGTLSPPVITEFTVGNSLVGKAAQQAGCTAANCVAGAWDVLATTTVPLPMTRRLISITDASNVIMDAIAYSDQTGGSADNGTQIQAAITDGYWTTACTASPCAANTGFDSAAINVSGGVLGTSASGASAQRTSDAAHSGVSLWHIAASSWGTTNN